MTRMVRLWLLVMMASIFYVLASAASAGEFPKGAFVAKVAADQWTLHFDGKGKFAVTRNDKVVVEGKYKIVKDEIEFTDESGSLAETGDAKTGSYVWKSVDKKLTFTKVKDNAEGRSSTLTSGPWEMKP
jgi:hypothetical protein